MSDEGIGGVVEGRGRKGDELAKVTSSSNNEDFGFGHGGGEEMFRERMSTSSEGGQKSRAQTPKLRCADDDQLTALKHNPLVANHMTVTL